MVIQDISHFKHKAWAHPPPITVFTAGTKVDPPGATFGPRLQPSLEFVWVRSGSVRARIDQRAVDGGPGTILLVQPGVRDHYDWSKSGRSVHSFLHFFFGPVPKTWPPEGGPIPLRTLPKDWPPPARWPLARAFFHGHTMFQLFRQVLSFFPLTEGRFKPLLGPTVELMLRLYLCGPADPPREASFDPGLPPPLEKVLTWLVERLRRNPQAKVRLSEMAEAAFVTPPYLCRLFAKELKIKPMECVKLLKAEYASELLERTQMTLKEISGHVGFENPFHFSRVYKEIYGLSPKAYREGFRKGTHLRPYSPIFRKYQLTQILSIATFKQQLPSFRVMPKKYRTKILGKTGVWE